MLNSKTSFDYFVSKISKIYPLEEAKSIGFLFFEEEFGLSKTDILIGKEINYFDFEPIINRLLFAEPIQHIIGKAEFFGYQFFVNNHVLIPRPETEELVQLAVNLLNKMPKSENKLKVLDIGTGSGCIAISIDKAVDNLNVSAMEVSHEALKIANLNKKALQSKVQFLLLDFLDESTWPSDKYDIIISNPPYVTQAEKALMHKNVLNFDPHLALFVPFESPLIFYEKIAKYAKNNLAQGGTILVEINEKLGSETSQCFVKQGFMNIDIVKDIHGKERFVSVS